MFSKRYLEPLESSVWEWRLWLNSKCCSIKKWAGVFLFDTCARLTVILMATKYLHTRAKQSLGFFNWFSLCTCDISSFCQMWVSGDNEVHSCLACHSWLSWGQTADGHRADSLEVVRFCLGRRKFPTLHVCTTSLWNGRCQLWSQRGANLMAVQHGRHVKQISVLKQGKCRWRRLNIFTMKAVFLPELVGMAASMCEANRSSAATRGAALGRAELLHSSKTWSCGVDTSTTAKGKLGNVGQASISNAGTCFLGWGVKLWCIWENRWIHELCEYVTIARCCSTGQTCQKLTGNLAISKFSFWLESET